ERGAGELAVLGLDPAPLQREAVRGEAQLGEEADVVREAVVVVAGVAAGLSTRRARRVLPCPPVVVPVVALPLGRRGGAPEKAGWKVARRHASPMARRRPCRRSGATRAPRAPRAARRADSACR